MSKDSRMSFVLKPGLAAMLVKDHRALLGSAIALAPSHWRDIHEAIKEATNRDETMCFRVVIRPGCIALEVRDWKEMTQ